MLKGDYSQAESSLKTALRLEKEGTSPTSALIPLMSILLGRTASYAGNTKMAEQIFADAAEFCRKNSYANSDVLADLYWRWALADKLSGNEQAYASHLKTALDYTAKTHRSAADILKTSIKSINQLYGHGAARDVPADLTNAKRGLDSMKQLLGANDLSYQSAVNEFEILFTRAGMTKRSQCSAR